MKGVAGAEAAQRAGVEVQTGSQMFSHILSDFKDALKQHEAGAAPEAAPGVAPRIPPCAAPRENVMPAARDPTADSVDAAADSATATSGGDHKEAERESFPEFLDTAVGTAMPDVVVEQWPAQLAAVGSDRAAMDAMGVQASGKSPWPCLLQLW